MPTLDMDLELLRMEIKGHKSKANKKSNFIFLLAVSLFFLGYGSSQVLSQAETKNREHLSKLSKQWLEEVVPYIITSEEKKAFENLPNEEERGKFINTFWRIRDPNPKTPENEFKLIYFKRIAFANKFFKTSAIPGWRTDRGRIYILLGPPSEIQRDLNPETSEFSYSLAATEVWSYMGLPSSRLPYNLEFRFVDEFGSGDYRLDTSLRLGEEGRTTVDITSMHYQFDYIENLAEALKTPFENLKELQGVITTQVTYDLIPINYNLFCLRGDEKNAFIPLVIEAPYSALAYKKIEDKYFYSLNFLINISNKIGQIIYRTEKNINFNHSQTEFDSLKAKALQAQASLMIEPEAYKLHLLASDNFSGKIGTLHQEILIPEYGEDKLALSEIILSHKEYVPDRLFSDSKRTDFERIFAEVNRVYSPDQEAHLYFEIYNLSINPETKQNDFSIEYSVFHNEDLIAHIPSSELDSTTRRDCRVQTTLKLRDYKPGTYLLRIRVIDEVSGKSTTKEIPFLIIDQTSVTKAPLSPS